MRNLQRNCKLLSSEKSRCGKRLCLIAAALTLGSMEAVCYGGLCYQNGIGIYPSNEQVFTHFEIVPEDAINDTILKRLELGTV